ncbi:hypothetical protein MLD38_038471 [Melastoma candidum]|uniref:Uncharacterized protein n=1 Tax=Melastoma candidum TaxID=119954 RepID=A0ACB9L017_9MYRT|nr:hypothetical protein MLD38_038471 [Melastoma candidum]
MSLASQVESLVLQPFFLLPLILFLTYLLWSFFLRPSSNSRSRSPPLPPGPRTLPLVGNLHSLDPELHTYFASLSAIHGPVCKLQLGGTLCIVISSPSAARAVLKDNDVIFANRDVPVAGRCATYGGRDIVWTPYGPEWRNLRKVCVLKMLSNNTLDSVYELRRSQMRKMVGYFYRKSGSEVNVGEQIFLTVLNVITSMMWGETVKGEERERIGAEFRQVVGEMTALLGLPNISDFFPALRRFDLQGVEKKMKVLVERLDTIFERVIEQRLEMDKSGGAGSGNKDFLQFLLKLKEEEDSKTPLEMVHIKALLMDMVVGGTDTTSNTVEFAMAEILNKPAVVAKIQDELDRVIGKDSIVEESHIHGLPYLRAVMKEFLRLHPPLPLMVPHCPSETCTVEGYTVPKGSRVFVNVWMIHRDPKVWDKPDVFDPERFADGNVDFSGNDFSYIPFGSGRRICAGVAMGERMVMYALATMLHLFEWKLPGDGKIDLTEQFGIVMKKKTPLVAVPSPRLSDPRLYE